MIERRNREQEFLTSLRMEQAAVSQRPSPAIPVSIDSDLRRVIHLLASLFHEEN